MAISLDVTKAAIDIGFITNEDAMKRTNSGQSLSTNLIFTCPRPDREEFEQEVHNLLPHGIFTDMALEFEKNISQISREFNPNVEQESVFYQTLLRWRLMDEIRDDLADSVISIMLQERAKWKQGRKQGRSTPAELTGRMGSALSDFVQRELEGRDVDEQIKFLTRLGSAVEKKRDSLLSTRGLSVVAGRGGR